MSVMIRIAGLILVGIGLLVVYGIYLIATFVSAIAIWLGALMGMPETATMGLNILLYIPIGGAVAGLIMLVCLLFYFGISFIVDK